MSYKSRQSRLVQIVVGDQTFARVDQLHLKM